MDVSIITINYKSHALLEKCIQSIYKQTKDIKFEIIIVDNSCDDNETEIIKEIFRNNLDIKIIKTDYNLGTSKANNLGALNASGDYLLFLNNDTILLNNAIKYLVETAINNHCAAVGSNLLTKDLKPAHSFICDEYNLKEYKKIHSLFLSLLTKVKKKRYDYNYKGNDIEIKGYACSATLLVEREKFFSVGKFDESIFMYGDDPLLCFNLIHKHNEKLFICGKSKIIHLEGGSDESIYSDFKSLHFVKGPFVYFCKAYGEEVGKLYLKECRKIYSRRKIIFKLLKRKVQYSNSKKILNAIAEIES